MALCRFCIPGAAGAVQQIRYSKCFVLEMSLTQAWRPVSHCLTADSMTCWSSSFHTIDAFSYRVLDVVSINLFLHRWSDLIIYRTGTATGTATATDLTVWDCSAARVLTVWSPEPRSSAFPRCHKHGAQKRYPTQTWRNLRTDECREDRFTWVIFLWLPSRQVQQSGHLFYRMPTHQQMPSQIGWRWTRM